MRVPIRISDMPASGQYEPPQEGDVTRWLKHAGDRVEQGEDIFEFENDKAATTVSSPFSGTLVEICFAAGSTWHRGELLEVKNGVSVYDPPFCWIETDGVLAPSVQEPASVSGIVEPVPVAIEAKRKPPFVPLAVRRLMEQYAISIDDILLRFPDASSFGVNEINMILSERGVGAGNCASQPLAMPAADSRVSPSYGLSSHHGAVPAARARARESGIDLSSVRGTGPDGVILLADVEACTVSNAQRSETALAATPPADTDEEIVLLKMSPLLRTIAENMDKANDIPTVDVMPTSATFDFTPLIAFYQRFHAQFTYAMWFPVMVATARVLGQEEFIVFNSFCVKEDGADNMPSHPSFLWLHASAFIWALPTIGEKRLALIGRTKQ